MNTFKVGDRVRYKDDGTLGTIQSPKSESSHSDILETYWIQWDDSEQLLWSSVDEIELVKENKSQSEEVKMKFKVGDRIRETKTSHMGWIKDVRNTGLNIAYWIEWDNRYTLKWSFESEIELVEENKSQPDEPKTEKVKPMISLSENREALKKLSSDIEDLELYDERIKGLEKNIEDFRCRREEIANRIRALGISVD